MDSWMKDLVSEIEGGGRYVAVGWGLQGKTFSGASLRSQFDVAIQVALNSASAFSSFEMRVLPSLPMSVAMRVDCF